MSNFFNPSVGDQNPQSGNDKDGKKRGFWSAYWRTAWLPGIGPRLKQLGWRLGHFAYLLALIYHAVRLIPAGHPVLNPVNIGKFGFRDVIGTAADNVKLSRENLDQVLMFFAVILGLVVIILQFLAIIGMVIADFAITQANAQVPGGVGSFFSVDDPTKDLALIGLEMVFGTDIFGAGAAVTPIVTAFHALLAFFSHVMLIIAIIILLYYVIVVVSESAMTGTPFGRRFNGFWAPVRLVVAFGLLIPMANGLNTAQYITLYAAKMGSNMASNGWALFTDTFFDPSTWVITPSGPELNEVAGAIFVNELCAYIHNYHNGEGSIQRRVRIPGDPGNAVNRFVQIRTYGAFGYRSVPLESFSLDMLGDDVNSAQRNVKIYWSRRQDNDRAPDATCGSINIQTRPDRIRQIENALNQNTIWGSQRTQQYYDALNQIRLSYFSAVGAMGNALYNPEIAPPLAGSDAEHLIASVYDLYRAGSNAEDADFGNADVAGKVLQAAQKALSDQLGPALETLRGNEAAAEAMQAQGWAGAGSFFMDIAKINGDIYDAVHESVPTVDQNPNVLERNPISRMGTGAINLLRRLSPSHSVDEIESSAIEQEARQILPLAASWFSEGLDAATVANQMNIGNSGITVGGIKTFASMLLGSQTLFNMKNDYDANPLAQLSAGGKELIQKSLLWFGFYVGAMVTAEMKTAGQVETLAIVTAGFAQLLITVGLTAGFILHFMVPLLPFMYFLFAVVGWISEIFEAIVAMPLWALAHIRIDGDGLPGQAASQGYYLIFGIFTRPIFILFGLIGAYLTFMAGVYLLHMTYASAISTMMGDGVGLGITSLGFTIMYVVIVYNMANTSFKLIDMVPNQIMRWIGSNAQSFSDGRQVDMQSMQGAAAVAGGFLGNQALQGMQSGMQKKMSKVQGRKQEAEQEKAADTEKERHNDLMAALGNKGGGDDSGSSSGSSSSGGGGNKPKGPGDSMSDK